MAGSNPNSKQLVYIALSSSISLSFSLSIVITKPQPPLSLSLSLFTSPLLSVFDFDYLRNRNVFEMQVSDEVFSDRENESQFE